jgi:hypothetical protein
MWLTSGRHQTTRKAGKTAGIGLPILGLAGFLAWEVPRVSPITYRQTDLLPLYLGLRALVAGHDPYSLDVGAEAYQQTAGHAIGLTVDRAAQFGFHYPLPQALLYLPFSLFSSLELATLLLRAATVALYLTALLCLIRRYAWASSLLTRASILLWGLAWWPFLAVILPIVQPTGIVLAALAWCLLALGARRWFWAGFALFFALLKPQDALPAVVVLLLCGLLHKEARWRLVAGFCAAALLPVSLAFAWQPGWVGAWLAAVTTLPAHIPGYYQNPPAQLAAMLGGAGILVWVGVGGLALGWLALAFKGISGLRGSAPSQPDREIFPGQERIFFPEWAFGVGCALALLLLPRTGGYELALGLLPWLIAWQQAARIQPRRARWALQSALWLLWLACGLLSYSDHGQVSSIALGLGLVVVLCLEGAKTGTGDAPSTTRKRAVTC